MGIADVIAHAMNSQFIISLPHHQVEELEAINLEAISVEVHADLTVWVVPEEGQTVHQEEHQDHHRS